MGATDGFRHEGGIAQGETENRLGFETQTGAAWQQGKYAIDKQKQLGDQRRTPEETQPDLQNGLYNMVFHHSQQCQHNCQYKGQRKGA